MFYNNYQTSQHDVYCDTNCNSKTYIVLEINTHKVLFCLFEWKASFKAWLQSADVVFFDFSKKRPQPHV